MNEIPVKYALLSDENLTIALEKLNIASTPNFGDMTAQQMLEHLILTIDLSYTKPYSPEKVMSDFQKQTRLAFLNVENPFPKGLKSSLYKEGMPELKYENLDTAKIVFFETIQKFKIHFEQNPKATYYNILFGEVNFDDLQLFHQKHISHHFGQFNLV